MSNGGISESQKMMLGGAATLFGAFIAWRACSKDAPKPAANQKEEAVAPTNQTSTSKEDQEATANAMNEAAAILANKKKEASAAKAETETAGPATKSKSVPAGQHATAKLEDLAKQTAEKSSKLDKTKTQQFKPKGKADDHAVRHPFVIGLGGGPGCGMSTSAKFITEALEREHDISYTIIAMNNFYKPIENRLLEIIKSTNKADLQKELQRIADQHDFDDPDMIDYELLTKCIDTLKLQNKPFMGPIYSRKNQTRVDGVNEIEPHQVIIVMGDLIFNNEVLREHLDLRIYVDADDDVRLSRTVLKNDLKPEGEKKDLAELLRLYEKSIKPCYEKYVEPMKKHAHMVIPNYGFSTVIVDLDKMEIGNVDPIVNHIEKQVNLRK